MKNRFVNEAAASRSGRLNSWLSMAYALQVFVLLILLPTQLLPSDAAWGWLILPVVLMSNSWWAFIHEAIHGSMFPDKRLNRICGRAHAIVFGAVFDLLRWGHLLHHAHSRTRRERSEVYAGQRPSAGFVVAYYLRLLGGLYLAEVWGSLLLLLPRSALLALQRRLAGPDNVIDELTTRLLEPVALRASRIDALLLILLHGLVIWLYGAHAWMYVLALAGRALAISLVDNAFHYGTALDDPRQAANLQLSRSLSTLILHFNLHGAHHRRPGLAWWQLPAYHAAHGASYQDDWLPALLRQLRGPIREDRLSDASCRACVS